MLYVLGKATGIAKEHSISKISVVMIVGKFKIMRSGPKAVTVVWVERGREFGVDCV